MKYTSGSPFFTESDINDILYKVKRIFHGEAFFTKGSEVKSFEKLFSEYVGTKHGVAVNSGTSALEIALKSIGVTSGDEIIVPVQTFVSTGSCVVNNNATPVFCEIDENYLLDIEDLKLKITNKTKAVIIVHFCGLIHPSIFEIRDYLKDRNIILIEDAAHAHGATINDIYAGNIGDFGCFSFYSTKIMTTGGEGGIITTNDDNYYELCASIGSIGIDNKSTDEIYSHAGSNNRMNEIQAIIGISQLKRLESFVKHRIGLAEIYKKKLSGLRNTEIINFQNFTENIRHSYWKFLIILNGKNINRDEIRNKMRRNNISVDWPYQPLLHLQPIFRERYGIDHGYLSKSENLAQRHLCLPLHLNIKARDAEYIADKFIECF